MRRRDFLRAAGGGAAASAAVGTAEAATTSDEGTTTGGNETTTGNGTTTSGGGSLPGSGTTETVAVGPGGNFVFEPETLYVQPGTTVNFVWESDFHNIVVENQPDGANWEGTPGGASTTYDTGYEYQFQFTVQGTYDYYCQPHRQQGMVAAVVVNESGEAPGGGGGGEEEPLNPEEMGVPFQAHYVGLATIVGIIVTLVYNFFVLKYGESSHASAPNKD
jgi:plastocyanin